MGCEVVRHAYKFGERLSADSAGCPLGGFSHWWRSVWVWVFGGGGVHTSEALASTVLLGYPSTKTARCGYLRARVLKAFSLLRFFVALDKEMTRRHAQGLIVIKKSARIKP